MWAQRWSWPRPACCRMACHGTPCAGSAWPQHVRRSHTPDSELFERWCVDKRNGVLLPGYSVEGTLAKKIQTKPSTIRTLAGRHVPLNAEVHAISFSGAWPCVRCCAHCAGTASLTLSAPGSALGFPGHKRVCGGAEAAQRGASAWRAERDAATEGGAEQQAPRQGAERGVPSAGCGGAVAVLSLLTLSGLAGAHASQLPVGVAHFQGAPHCEAHGHPGAHFPPLMPCAPLNGRGCPGSTSAAPRCARARVGCVTQLYAPRGGPEVRRNPAAAAPPR